MKKYYRKTCTRRKLSKDWYIFQSPGGGKAKVIKELAAQELQKHLELIFGKEIPINTDGKVADIKPAKGLYFLVGYKPDDISKNPKPFYCHYAVRGNKIYFWGHDRIYAKKMLDRRSSRGTANAVYSFLDRVLKVRWITPGDIDIVFNPRSSLDLPEKLDFAWTMPFSMSKVRVYTWRPHVLLKKNKLVPEKLKLTEEYAAKRHYENTLWAARMRMADKIRIAYGHAFTNWWDKYGKTHPEYFGSNAYGKRGLSNRWKRRVKLCVSNPAVINQIIAEWKKDGKKKYMNICENDGTMGYCRCKDCMALDTRTPQEGFYEHLTDRYIYFVNQVAKQAVKERQDVMVVFYAYSYYRHKPRRERIEYPDNTLLGIVPQVMEDSAKTIADWTEVGAKHFFLRPNDLAYNLPIYRGMEKHIYDKFQECRKYNLFGTDYDGSCGIRSIDFEYYTALRMISFPDKSFAEIEDEYVSAYGGAADAVKKFYAFYRTHCEKLLKEIHKTLIIKRLQLRDSGQLTAVMSNQIDKFIANKFSKAEAILTAGRSDKLSPTAAARLEELIINNQHAALSYALIREANKKKAGQANELEQVGNELLAFRVKFNKLLRYPWPRVFRYEQSFWSQIPWYRKDVLKIHNEDDKSMVFYCSFDLPAMDGWKARDNFIEITNFTASFDQYSIKLKTTEKGRVGISRHNEKVVPGAKYRISFDSKLDKDVKYARLRCVAKGKTFFNIYNRDNTSGLWRTKSKVFTVPEGSNKLNFYIYSGPGNSDNFVYIDKVMLQRVKE